jgi:hypothetical protein
VINRKPPERRAVDSIAFGAGWPDDRDWYALVSGNVYHVGRSAVIARWLSIPDGNQFVRLGEHVQAGVHVCVWFGLDVIKRDDLHGLGDQGVVGGVMLRQETVAILLSRHDDVKCAAVVEYGSGEESVGSVGEAGQTDQFAARVLVDLGVERGADQRTGCCGQSAVPGYGEAGHPFSRS